MPELNLVDAINLCLRRELERDERVVLLGEDVGLNGGVFRVTDGLQKDFGEDRVQDSPLSESGIMGTAVGMAQAGLRPVPEIQFEGFLGPAYDQLVNQAARSRVRNRAGMTCPMTVRVPVGGGIHAPELHSDSPEAVYVHTPGLKVLMPSRPKDAFGLLRAAIRDPDPVIFFEPKRVYRSFKEEVPDDPDFILEMGQADLVEEGDDITVITWGAMLFRCMEAIDKLPESTSADLIDLRSLWPIDVETIANSVNKTGRAIVVHEAPKTCGLGAEISSLIQEHCFLNLQAPVQRVTGFDVTMPYYKLENHYLPDAPRIGRALRETVAY
jgi:pyruvate/2-oxoglutarate/acetoin dehydrogenase E1 component